MFSSFSSTVGKKITIRENGLTCGFCSCDSLLIVIMDEVEWPQIVSSSREVKGLIMTCSHHLAYVQNTSTQLVWDVFHSTRMAYESWDFYASLNMKALSSLSNASVRVLKSTDLSDQQVRSIRECMHRLLVVPLLYGFLDLKRPL